MVSAECNRGDNKSDKLSWLTQYWEPPPPGIYGSASRKKLRTNQWEYKCWLTDDCHATEWSRSQEGRRYLPISNELCVIEWYNWWRNEICPREKLGSSKILDQTKGVLPLRKINYRRRGAKNGMSCHIGVESRNRPTWMNHSLVHTALEH